MESKIQLIIIAHAALGGIALLAGLIAIIAKKGRAVHRVAGKVFFYSILLSIAISLIIAILPKHENPFLFAIGIFSGYFALTGYRAIGFKRNTANLFWDKVISWSMVLTGIFMLLYNPLFHRNLNIVLTAFGLVGLIFALRDLKLYKQQHKLRENWLKLHLGKMMGAYISATTAFVVVNNFFPGVYGWFIPGIIGGAFIALWMRRINQKN